MKRILAMALVACFVLGAGMANAKEMSFQGQFEHAVQWMDNANFFEYGANANEGDQTGEDDFKATQRIRLYFNYIDSETLRGVVGFEIDTDWGSLATANGKGKGGGALGTDGTTVEVKHAYTDFQAGGVSFRVGLQPLGWPSAVAGNPIWSNDVAGIVASYKFNDMVSVVGGWARLLDANVGDDGLGGVDNDEIDAFTLMAPITADGWNLTPYVIYAAVGQDTYAANGNAKSLLSSDPCAYGDDVDAWWAGAAFTLDKFDPIVFSADLIYGSVDGDNSSQNDREGWFFAAELDYKMDMVTPGLVFVYGTGNDDDITDGSEAMPNLAGGPGGSSGFGLTTTGFDGAHWTADSGALLGDATSNMGLWAIGLTLKDFSLLENLNQTFTIVYGMGTNDADGVKGRDLGTKDHFSGLTDEDSFWEVNLNSDYALYENLTIWSELAYVKADLDDDTWAGTLGKLSGEEQACTKFALGIRYNF